MHIYSNQQVKVRFWFSDLAAWGLHVLPVIMKCSSDFHKTRWRIQRLDSLSEKKMKEGRKEETKPRLTTQCKYNAVFRKEADLKRSRNYLSWTSSPQDRLLQRLRKHWTLRPLSVALPAPQRADIAFWFGAAPDPVAYVWVSVAVWTRACPFGIAVSSCQADRVQNVKLQGNICRVLPDALVHKHQKGGKKKTLITQSFLHTHCYYL